MGSLKRKRTIWATSKVFSSPVSIHLVVAFLCTGGTGPTTRGGRRTRARALTPTPTWLRGRSVHSVGRKCEQTDSFNITSAWNVEKKKHFISQEEASVSRTSIIANNISSQTWEKDNICGKRTWQHNLTFHSGRYSFSFTTPDAEVLSERVRRVKNILGKAPNSYPLNCSLITPPILKLLWLIQHH